MAVNDLIQIRKGTSAAWTLANPVLASGEPGYDLTDKIFKIGDGVSNWASLGSINLSSSNITDFNSAISGVLPVKSISAGNNITISSVNGAYTINSSNGGASASFAWSTVPSSPTASGVAGNVAYDSDYFYVATDNNTWKRSALSTWIVSSPTPTVTITPTITPTITVTPTVTPTPTPTSVFDTTLTIASGTNSSSGNGVTLSGTSGSKIRFNQILPINNPLSFIDIRIYIAGVYSYRITTYSEVVTANKTFTLATNTGTTYVSSFGAGTDLGSYRRINF